MYPKIITMWSLMHIGVRPKQDQLVMPQTATQARHMKDFKIKTQHQQKVQPSTDL
jgi:hypothetical protein